MDVATRADGTMWRLPFLTVTGAKKGATLLVTGAVHGDEYEGVESITQLFSQIEPQALQGNLLMLPICNMPAYEVAHRNSPIDALNLARVFPGKQDGTITQRIAYWITEKLLKHADFFIDLHSAGIAYDIPTLIGYIHSDDDLGQRSRAAAEAFAAPILWGHPLPIPSGRSISAATDLNVPSLYTEAPGGGYAHPDDIACFVDGVINVMKHLSMLEGMLQTRPMTHHLLGDGNLDTVISAPTAGYFRAQVNLLDEVKGGDCLGTIQDSFGQVVTEIKADRDGVVIMLRRLHRVHVGDGLVHLTNYLNNTS
ncbi:MAG: succinylglutamate desuccinylase/aspartoacylase family protein [Anaerolineae bacterium]|nr:succinylglutamate desuccinylase/aspartoacylase family protein [Anaerolineae bacterium]